MNLPQSLLLALSEFLRRNGKTVYAVLSAVVTVMLVNDKNKAQDAIQGVQKFDAMERRSRTRGGIDSLRQKYSRK